MATTTTIADECVVCLELLLIGGGTRTLVCGHVFHSTCITDALARRASCPICRAPIDAVANAGSRGPTDATAQGSPPRSRWSANVLPIVAQVQLESVLLGASAMSSAMTEMALMRLTGLRHHEASQWASVDANYQRTMDVLNSFRDRLTSMGLTGPATGTASTGLDPDVTRPRTFVVRRSSPPRTDRSPPARPPGPNLSPRRQSDRSPLAAGRFDHGHSQSERRVQFDYRPMGPPPPPPSPPRMEPPRSLPRSRSPHRSRSPSPRRYSSPRIDRQPSWSPPPRWRSDQDRRWPFDRRPTGWSPPSPPSSPPLVYGGHPEPWRRRAPSPSRRPLHRPGLWPSSRSPPRSPLSPSPYLRGAPRTRSPPRPHEGCVYHGRSCPYARHRRFV